MIDHDVIRTFRDAVENNIHLVEALSKIKTKNFEETKKWKAKFGKLEKDMEEMKITAQETRNSSVVSNFASAISINTEKMEQLKIKNDRLRNTVKAFGRNQKNTDRLVEQNNILIQKIVEEREQFREDWKKEREINSRLYSDNTHLLQQINQLQTEMQNLRDEQKTKNIEDALCSPPGPPTLPLRLSAQQQKPKEEQQQQRVETNNQMQNIQNGINSRKFVFVSSLYDLSFLSSENVEYIDYWEKNLDSLDHNISSYQKDMLVWIDWEFMNTISGYANYFANLLSLCRQWKRLRPDGRIHCIYHYEEGESPSKPDKKLFSLLTSCKKYLRTGDASLISGIYQCWPDIADWILSEETKKKYPKRSSSLIYIILLFVFILFLPNVSKK